MAWLRTLSFAEPVSFPFLFHTRRKEPHIRHQEHRVLPAGVQKVISRRRWVGCGAASDYAPAACRSIRLKDDSSQKSTSAVGIGYIRWVVYRVSASSLGTNPPSTPLAGGVSALFLTCVDMLPVTGRRSSRVTAALARRCRPCWLALGRGSNGLARRICGGLLLARRRSRGGLCRRWCVPWGRPTDRRAGSAAGRA